jgi:hypothetical protein
MGDVRIDSKPIPTFESQITAACRRLDGITRSGFAELVIQKLATQSREAASPDYDKTQIGRILHGTQELTPEVLTACVAVVEDWNARNNHITPFLVDRIMAAGTQSMENAKIKSVTFSPGR